MSKKETDSCSEETNAGWGDDSISAKIVRNSEAFGILVLLVNSILFYPILVKMGFGGRLIFYLANICAIYFVVFLFGYVNEEVE